MKSPKGLAWKDAPQGILTTGIGSLPHHNVDAALQYSFRHLIPFLPQIPVRNPKEFMIRQALDGLPGLRSNDAFDFRVAPNEWKEEATAFRSKIRSAFHNAEKYVEAFSAFDPSVETWNAWKPFLWELENRRTRLAKVQIAGPLTCQWSLRFSDGSPVEKDPELSATLLELVLARALCLVRNLKIRGVRPLIYLDEPGLYCLSKDNPRHVIGMNELSLFIQTLKKEEALVGLHCCSNTQWDLILNLPIDILSIDVRLSLRFLSMHPSSVASFYKRGGRFSFGVIPTGLDSPELGALKTELLFEAFKNDLSTLSPDPSFAKAVMRDGIYTPACGLALHSIADAEKVLSHLSEFTNLVRAFAE